MGPTNNRPNFLARFRHRSSAKNRLLVRALYLLFLTRLGLWLLPFRTMRQWAQSQSIQSQYKSAQAKLTVAEICQSITAAARFIPGASCLTQALVGQILLTQADHEVVLQIGVAKTPGSPLKAHAWLESTGQVVLGNLPDLSEMHPLRPPTPA